MAAPFEDREDQIARLKDPARHAWRTSVKTDTPNLTVEQNRCAACGKRRSEHTEAFTRDGSKVTVLR